MQCAKMVERAEAFRISHLIVDLLEDRNHGLPPQSSFILMLGHIISLCGINELTLYFLLRNGFWVPGIVISHPLAHIEASKDV